MYENSSFSSISSIASATSAAQKPSQYISVARGPCSTMSIPIDWQMRWNSERVISRNVSKVSSIEGGLRNCFRRPLPSLQGGGHEGSRPEDTQELPSQGQGKGGCCDV